MNQISKNISNNIYFLQNSNNQKKNKVFFSILVSFIGKAIGLLRLQQIASIFGSSIISDNLFIVFGLSWFVQSVIIEGSVNPTLISKIYSIDQKFGYKKSITLFIHISLICLLIALLISSLFLIYPKFIINIFLSEISQKSFNVLSLYLSLASPIPILFSVLGTFSLINRLLNNGVWYSMNLLFANSISLAGFVIGNILGCQELSAKFGLVSLNLSLLIAIFIQYKVIPLESKKIILKALENINIRILSINKFLYIWKPSLILFSMALINEIYIYVDIFLSTKIGPGSLSLLNYSNRLCLVIYSVTINAAFAIIEPYWSKLLSLKGNKAWRQEISNDTLALMNLVSIPAIILFILPYNFLQIIYKFNNFSQIEINSIVNLTRIFSLGILLISLSFIFNKAVVLSNNQKNLFFNSTFSLITKIISSFFLIKYIGINGIAISTLLAYLFNILFNFFMLNKNKVSFNNDIFIKLFFSIIFNFLICYIFKIIIPFSGFYLLLSISFIAILVNLLISKLFKIDNSTILSFNNVLRQR